MLGMTQLALCRQAGPLFTRGICGCKRRCPECVGVNTMSDCFPRSLIIPRCCSELSWCADARWALGRRCMAGSTDCLPSPQRATGSPCWGRTRVKRVLGSGGVSGLAPWHALLLPERLCRRPPHLMSPRRAFCSILSLRLTHVLRRRSGCTPFHSPAARGTWKDGA